MSDAMRGLRMGLGGLPMRTRGRTRSLSAENPTGEKGRGGMAIPDRDDPKLPFSRPASDLGQGWKVNPFIKLDAGETATIADVDGPGIIQHIWIATEPGYGRRCSLRFYWDEEEDPSVQAPLGDFFAVGHDIFAPVNSLPVVSNAAFGLNCYWPMPFRKHCKITVSNDGEKDMKLLAYQITYTETEISDDLAYFHAHWRRAVTERSNPDYTILEDATGAGHYVGTFLAWTPLSHHWFGEGEIKFFIDGDDQFPTICGTGTEDYFGAAFGFPQLYSTPFLGNTLQYPPDRGEAARTKGFDPMTSLSSQNHGPQKVSLYRWHILDPISFEQDLRVTIQALGWWPDRKFQPLADDIASVAYWYQTEPHAKLTPLPGMSERWTR